MTDKEVVPRSEQPTIQMEGAEQDLNTQQVEVSQADQDVSMVEPVAEIQPQYSEELNAAS